MKTILDGFKKGLGIGIGISFIITTGVLAYQYTNYSELSDVSNGTTLTSSSYNQLLANIRDLNNRISNQTSSPIGSILAWHKNLSGVPALPAGWVECNGQVLSDSTSPLNGKTIPDLNNSPSGYNGGRFLRGGTTSGIMQAGTSTRHADWFLSQNLTQNNDGTYTVSATNYNTLMSATAQNATYALVRPVNMSVVWIMRVK